MRLTHTHVVYQCWVTGVKSLRIYQNQLKKNWFWLGKEKVTKRPTISSFPKRINDFIVTRHGPSCHASWAIAVEIPPQAANESPFLERTFRAAEDSERKALPLRFLRGHTQKIAYNQRILLNEVTTQATLFYTYPYNFWIHHAPIQIHLFNPNKKMIGIGIFFFKWFFAGHQLADHYQHKNA